VKPTYEVRAWQEGDWWLVRVVRASNGADAAPVNGLTQARTLAQVEPMARDLVATILDGEEDAFGITVDYVLSDDASDLVRQATTARAWVEAAKDLWQDRSAAAARTLTEKGYSLRETAALLGISHQRVDQILGRASVMERAFAENLADYLTRTGPRPECEVDVLFLVSGPTGHATERRYLAEMDQQFQDEVGAALLAWQSRIAGHGGSSGDHDRPAAEAPEAEPSAAEVIRHGWAIVEA
jgi:transcriptional regulator with XRE-family HTH domain